MPSPYTPPVVNFWSILSQYSSDKFQIIVDPPADSKVKITVWGIQEKRFLGMSIPFTRRLVERATYDLQIVEPSPFSQAMNPAFARDRYVDVADFMHFAEVGFNENQRIDLRDDLLHCAVGMSEESGEVMGLIKKHVYHSAPLHRTKLLSELGDFSWYFFNFLRLNNISLSDVFLSNRTKLAERYPNGRGRNFELGPSLPRDEAAEYRRIEEATGNQDQPDKAQ